MKATKLLRARERRKSLGDGSFRGEGEALAPVTVTLWPSRSIVLGRRSALTWAEFIARYVADPEPSDEKRTVAGFSLGTFDCDRRSLARVIGVVALTLDFDDGATSMDEAACLFPRTKGVVYTSYSSTPAKPKLRLILRLRRPVSADEYARLWLWASRRCTKRKHPIDQSAKDASRFWYIPSHPVGCTTYAWRTLPGRLLDVDSLLQGAARAVLPGLHSGTGAREASAHRKDGKREPAATTASETLLGRAFVAAKANLTDSDRADGTMFVTCPWERRHTTDGDASSSVVFPSKSAARTGHFHCLHRHCAGRTTRDVLRALPPAAVSRARAAHGLEERVRVTVVDARLESRPAWDARPPLIRWRLELATRDGEILRGNITLPTPGYEHSRQAYDAVVPNLRWSSALAHFAEWKRRGLVPLGMKLVVKRLGNEITSMRAVPQRKGRPRRSETAPRHARAAGASL